MKIVYFTLTFLFLSLILPNNNQPENKLNLSKDFQGKATYISKTKMDLGNWGAKLTEVQKKQIEARMKNRLEKTYTLTFNNQESFFKEDDKIDAISGATITGDGVTDMIKERLQHYLPYLKSADESLASNQ